MFNFNGGELGIRTLGTVSRTHALQACSFNRSDNSPLCLNIDKYFVALHVICNDI